MDAQLLQKFWVESIDKESAVRVAWHLKYSKKFARGAVEKNAPKGKNAVVFNSSVSDKIKKMENDKKHRTAPCATSSKPIVKTPEKLSKSDGALAVRDMRPSTQGTLNLLYNGISSQGEGRYAYLKKRKEKIPEEKYEFPLLTSCQYGWKILQYYDPSPSPYARASVIKDSFYRNSGITFA